MRRREFIALLGIVAAWPLAAKRIHRGPHILGSVNLSCDI